MPPDRRISVSIGICEEKNPAFGHPPSDDARRAAAWLANGLPDICFPAGIEPMEWGREPDMAPEIEVLLCSRPTMSGLSGGDDGCLGLHLVENPDGDPFGDCTPYTRSMRVAVAINIMDMTAHLRSAMLLDAHDLERYQPEYEESKLATVFHEIAHAVLFMANTGLISPEAVEGLSGAGQLDHDLFDMSTGYGIRPLPDEDGHPVWAETTDEARDQMEHWCEWQSRAWARQAMARCPTSFLEAIGTAVPAVIAEIRAGQDAPSP